MNREWRFTRFQDIGCLCCAMEGYLEEPVDVHHLVDKGTRELSGGDMASIPICPWHHRGVPRANLKLSEMKFLFGPSIRLHHKQFLATYGSHRRLLELTDELLALPLFEIRERLTLLAQQAAGSDERHMREVRA